MKNPYKHLRERAGYTQKKFCTEFDFAKQTLLSIEQGVYEELSVRMLAAIDLACDNADINVEEELAAEYGTASLTSVYARWRRVERASCDSRIVKYVPEYHFSDLSPMHWFVQSTTGSVQGFAKQLKVQTATILSYTTGKQKDMPHPIREALVDAGYEHIGLLEKLQNDWNKDQ